MRSSFPKAFRWLTSLILLASSFGFAQLLGRDPIVEGLLIDSRSVRYDCTDLGQAFGQAEEGIAAALQVLANLEARMMEDSGLELDVTCGAFEGDLDRFQLQFQVFLRITHKDVLTQVSAWEAVGPYGFMTLLLDEDRQNVYLVFFADFLDQADVSLIFVGVSPVP